MLVMLQFETRLLKHIRMGITIFKNFSLGGISSDIHSEITLCALLAHHRKTKEALALRRAFSLVGMITNTKFSNCTLVFKIGGVRQQNMQNKHQNTFQSNLSLTKQ